MNKKGFELSINFIVMLILAIAVFGFGLYFVSRIFTEANQISADMDKQTEQNVLNLLDRGERVAVPLTSKTIKPDGTAVFGLGILNVNQDETNFAVNIRCIEAVDKADRIIGPMNGYSQEGCAGKWTFDIPSFSLAKNSKKLIPIAIQPPSNKPSGTYAFLVNVTNAVTHQVYGGAPKLIYVTIS